MHRHNERVMVSAIGLLLLCSCNGQLYHGPEAAADVIKQCGSKNVHCGVPFALLVTGVQTSQTTVLVDDKVEGDRDRDRDRIDRHDGQV